MTRNLEHQNAGTPTGLWFRRRLKDSQDGLTVIDIDTTIYVFEEYERNLLMLVEEKPRGDKVRYAQRKTMQTIDRLLLAGAKECGYGYWGYHVLALQNTTPENSEWIKWDGYGCTVDGLVRILNFETRSVTPSPKSGNPDTSMRM